MWIEAEASQPPWLVVVAEENCILEKLSQYMQNKNGVDLIKVSLTRFQLASSFNFDGTRLVSRLGGESV